MAYVDYRFYSEKYFGDIIPQDSFLKFSEYASDHIDQITFDRLIDGLPENERDKTKVQKAVCAVADAIYQIDSIRKASMETVGTVKREDGTVVGKAVSSVSSGAESITYTSGQSGISDIYLQAAMDKKVENAIYYQIAVEYLSGVTDNKGVCLLYAGL